jgi:hypothetical protein
MGTWGSGLFDGDGPLDVIDDLASDLDDELVDLTAATPSAETAGRLSGVIGLLLQLSPTSFDKESEAAATIVEAIEHHREVLPALSAPAGELLLRIVAGEGQSLADRDGDRKGKLEQALGNYIDYYREPALFEHPAAHEVTQRFAERCAEIIDELLAAPELDPYEVLDVGGPLGLLLLVEPCRVDPARCAAWRQTLRAIGERSRDAANPDLAFFTEYLQNADLAFELLASKFGPGSTAGKEAR